MTLLIAGITLWFVTHLFPAAAPRKRDKLIKKLSKKQLQALFDEFAQFILILYKSLIQQSINNSFSKSLCSACHYSNFIFGLA